MIAAVTRPTLIQRLGRVLIVSFGLVVIVLAVALGLFRFALGQIPEYQDEIKAFVAAELGLTVEFAAIDARLGFAGPELSLSDASIGSGVGGGFLEAGQASITFDPLTLVFGRRLEVSRLTLGGVVLTVERDRSGTFRFGDRAVEPGAGTWTDNIPPSVEVVIRDSALEYVDSARGRRWRFDELEAVLESSGGQLEASLSLRPEIALAGPVEVELTARLPDDEGNGIAWQADVAAPALDLAVLALLAPVDALVPLSGRGDVRGRLEWADGQFVAAGLETAFRDLAIGPPEREDAAIPALSFSADWRRTSAGEWQLRLDDIAVVRNGRQWPSDLSAEFSLAREAGETQMLHLAADFVRLQDLAPLLSAFPSTQIAEQWALFEPEGDVRDLDFSFENRDGNFLYALDVDFADLAVRQVGQTPGLRGVSGSIQATEDSGTIDFASGPWSFDWPTLFPRVVEAGSLTGAVVWRQGRDVVQLLSVDLGLGLLGEEVSASFDLRLPRDGQSPVLELKASLPATDLAAGRAYLPEPIMPASVYGWLARGVTGGRGRNIELSYYGPVAGFPFDDGSGQFSVTADIEGAEIHYMDGWPVAEDLTGRVEFRNAGFSGSGSGRVLGNVARAIDIAIPDMRQPLLTLTTESEGPLVAVNEFLRAVPLIADHLGPDFARIDARGGTGVINARIDLPLRDVSGYAFDARLAIAGGTVAVAGLGPEFSEIEGSIDADESRVTADAIDAVFLGGPVSLSLGPSASPGYRAEIVAEGETTAEAVTAAFSLPYEDLLAGQTLWRGRLLLPSLNPLATQSMRLLIESNLTGLALRFPEPLAKAPAEPTNLSLDFDFAAGGRLEVAGNVGATRRFALSFDRSAEGLEFARAAVRFGGGEPVLPIQPGVLVDGQIETLALDEWFALADRTGIGQVEQRFLGADLTIADFSVFRQQLGASRLTVQRGNDAWRIDIGSEPISGRIVVPRGTNPRAPIEADMRRVYLATAESASVTSRDPRQLPGLRLTADELGLGPRRLGRVSANLIPDARGLVLEEFVAETDSFRAEITGSWYQGSLGMRTSVEAKATSTDVATALGELGFDQVISGEAAEITASVYWNAPPGEGWLDHLYGEVGIHAETGTLREVDPGAGRVVGLMSIAALPRRLALDFRDVFEEGFAFDEISGNFRVVDGNAYTDNLKFSGPAAEIGVVGRTGLGARDYRQQIVVTTEPGNMLPTVAGLLAGPGAGAALFVFTRLFKEPLKGIGRASYCLTGDWDAPTVEPIERDAPEQAASCADLPDDMLPTSDDD
jgi:uncharacterized protein (TIGR02099 family)